MKCPKCENKVNLLDKRTGKQVNQCDNCNAKFKLNRDRKIFTDLIIFFLLTFLLGFFDLNIFFWILVLVPYLILTTIHINKLEVEE